MKYTGKDFFNLAWKVLEMSDYINFIRPLKAALEMKDLTGELKKTNKFFYKVMKSYCQAFQILPSEFLMKTNPVMLVGIWRSFQY